MASHAHSIDGADGASAFAALAAGRRRRVLAVLHGRDHQLTVPDLATFVAARESGRDPAAIPDDRYHRVLLSLQHVHLPKLEHAGLIEHTDGVVAPADTSSTIRVVARLAADAGPSIDDVFGSLADRQRLAIVDVLTALDESIDVAALAEKVATVEPSRDPDRLAISLDHVHLPTLEDAGIVSYERDRARVTYEGLPQICQWLLADRDTPDVDDWQSVLEETLVVFPTD